MLDIILLIGMVVGVILIIIGKRNHNYKILNLIGVLVLLIFLIFAAPYFIAGFKAGYASAFHS